jgi:RNA 3'-terminal phosphate cyclase (ATP)
VLFRSRQLDHLLSRLRTQLRFEDTALERVDADGPADVLLLDQPHAALTEVLCVHGERGVSAERLADRLATEALMLGGADVPVGPFLADQLLLPMAMARGGEFRTVTPTRHCTTNATLIEHFLPVAFGFAEDRERPGSFVVRCEARR